MRVFRRQFVHFVLLLLVIAIMTLGRHSSALATLQVDPFDPFATNQPAAPAVTQPTATADDDLQLEADLSNGVKLVIQSIAESNPTTAVELAQALKTMVTIKQYPEAQRYLQQLIALNPSGPQMFELSETLGSAFWLELRTLTELQPQGAQFAETVIRTAKAEAFSANRINQLITELSDENKFVRQDAFSKLSRLGAPAVAVMLQVCDQRGRRKEVPYVASALEQMGREALYPLIGAARADGTLAQAVAASSLSNMRSPIAADVLLRMAISSAVPPSVREIASEAVARQRLTTPESIMQRIYDRANDYLSGRVRLTANGSGQTQIWNWNFAQRRLIGTQLAEQDAVAVMAVDLARDVFRLQRDNAEYRHLQLLTVLEATKRIVGPDRDVSLSEVVPFIEDLNQQDLETGLVDAQRRNLIWAAVAAASLLGQQGDISALIKPDGKNSTLIDALLSGHRQLQFAAAKAIAQIDPKQPYAGSSYLAHFMTLIANSSGNSAAIAVHPRPDAAQRLASSIFQSGRTGLSANSSTELFEALNRNPDIDFVMITDSIARPHYQELVQQLRSYWVSQQMPIALLVRGEQRERQADLVLRNDSKTLVMPLADSAKSVFSQVNRLADRLPASALTNVQRELQAQFALAWIAKVMAGRKAYDFYDLNRFEDRLITLTQTPGSVLAKSLILANMSSPTSQKLLVELATDAGFQIEQRRQLVDAFSQSVERSGLLLSRQEIVEQFNRLAANNSDNGDNQQVSNSIIAVIEKAMHAEAGEDKASVKP